MSAQANSGRAYDGKEIEEHDLIPRYYSHYFTFQDGAGHYLVSSYCTKCFHCLWHNDDDMSKCLACRSGDIDPHLRCGTQQEPTLGKPELWICSCCYDTRKLHGE